MQTSGLVFFKLWSLGLPQKTLEDHNIPRLVKATFALGKVMSFTQSEIEKLIMGVCLHDMGKLFAPQHLLKKKGELSFEEKESLKQHTVLGAGFLVLTGFHQRIVEVARHHHENWDGTGYPDGLRKDQIPIFARIMRVIDTLDALIVKRVYQDAMSETEALKKIQKKSGSFFDPEIVNLLPRILAVH